jgi:hypothetical protein
MISYPIQTLITFAVPAKEDTPKVVAFGTELQVQAELMQEAEKTLGDVRRVAQNTFKRTWIDQAAAEEWREFALATALKHGVTITDIEISADTE